MNGILDTIRRKHKTVDKDSEESRFGNYSEADASLALLNQICDTEFEISEQNVVDITVEYDVFQQIQDLPIFEERELTSPCVWLLQKYSDQYSIQVRVTITEDQEVSVNPECLFYTADEIHNDAICDFIRRIGHFGPRIKVDLEGEEPVLRYYLD